MNVRPAVSRWTVRPAVSRWTVNVRRAVSRWTVNVGPAVSRWTVNVGPAVSRWTVNVGPAVSRWTVDVGPAVSIATWTGQTATWHCPVAVGAVRTGSVCGTAMRHCTVKRACTASGFRTLTRLMPVKELLA